MSKESTIVRTITDSALIIGLSAGISFVGKKALKESYFLGDPSTNVTNYAKWVAVLAGATALKEYLEKEKILPNSM